MCFRLIKISLVKTVIALILVAMIGYFVIVQADTASMVVKSSLVSCLTVIIPSIFAFMALSTFLVESGLYKIISIPFYPIARYVLRIDSKLFSIFLISLIGGYPVGAKLLTMLVENGEITSKQAEKMMCYCYGSGPSFIFGLVAMNVYSNVRVGVIILASSSLASFIVAYIVGLTQNIPQKKHEDLKLNISSQALINSVNSTSQSLLSICSLIVLFSVFTAFLDSFGVIEMLSSFLTTAPEAIKTFFEVSNVSTFSGTINEIALICGLLSFGGLCVIMQITSVVKGNFSLKWFTITRPFIAVLSGLICWLFSQGQDFTVTASTTRNPSIVVNSATPFTSVLLMIMSLMLLAICNNKRNSAQK